MSKRVYGQARGKYTLEFKLLEVSLVKGGQTAVVTAQVLGIPNQTPDNWVRLNNKSQLKGAGAGRHRLVTSGNFEFHLPVTRHCPKMALSGCNDAGSTVRFRSEADISTDHLSDRWPPRTSHLLERSLESWGCSVKLGLVSATDPTLDRYRGLKLALEIQLGLRKG